jgi:hypothetical protein
MKLFTEAQRRELIAKGERSAAGEHIDPHPIVKLFTPDAGATWLLTEYTPIGSRIAAGTTCGDKGCTTKLTQANHRYGASIPAVQARIALTFIAPLLSRPGAIDSRRIGKFTAATA